MLLGYLWSLVVFLFTLTLLVVIHEFGHFILCKKFNIKVLEFGFGIPPKAWGKKVGETLISVNWLPLGGFVRPLGEDGDLDTGKLLVKARREWKERSFPVQPVWKRIAVVVAGVVMNLLLAWVLFYVVIASQGFSIIYPALKPAVSISFLEPGFPAEVSGLKIGDQITKINGQDVSDIQEAVTLIRQSTGPVDLYVTDIDGGSGRNIVVTPKTVGPDDRKIGVAFSPVPIKKYNSLPEKIFSGVAYSYDVTKATFLGLGQVIANLEQKKIGQASQGLSGPVGIAVITNNIVQQGWQAFTYYLWFVGLLSMALFIFNILPLPALDGGRLFFLLFEAVTGRRVDENLERKIHTVGMVVLLTLIVLITLKDINMFILPKIQQLFRL